MNEKHSSFKPYLSLFGGLIFIGFAAIIIKLSAAPGIVTAFYRMTIASAILIWPFLYSTVILKSPLRIRGVVFAFLAGMCFGIDMSTWSTGVVMSNATIPTLMANLAPIWVGFGSMIIFKEKHKQVFWIGLSLATAGVIIVLGKDIYSSTAQMLGTLLGIIAGFFYGAFYLLSQHGRKFLNTLSYLFISTLGSTFVLIIFIFLFNYKLSGYDMNTWILFFAIGIGVQVFGWMMVNYAQGYLPASIVSATLLGQPVLTALFAIVLLKEKLTLWHIGGGLIVIAGIFLVHNSKATKRQ